MSTTAGASRMSSVLGLKARPQTAKRRPVRSSPNCAWIWRARSSFWSSFTASTAWSMRKSRPSSEAVRISAFTSLGKHDPP